MNVTGIFFACDSIESDAGEWYPPGKYEWVRSDDLLTGHLGIAPERINPATGRRLKPIMRRLGWTPGRHYFGGDKRQRGYFRQIR
jgi:hypothetical protein